MKQDEAIKRYLKIPGARLSDVVQYRASKARSIGESMKQDEALEVWIKLNVGMPPSCTTAERTFARDAWHAAVKHTLEHVAGEVDKKANRTGDFASSTDNARFMANVMRNVAADIMTMKP